MLRETWQGETATPSDGPWLPSIETASPAPTVVIEPRARLFDLDLSTLWEYRELVYFMVWRDVKTRYKQTVLGVAWALLQPVLTMLVFWVVFSQFARVPSEGLPYPLFAFIGLLPWTYFSQAVARSSGGLVGNANLIGKVYFPRLIIPLAAALSPAVDLAVSFLVLIGLLLWYAIVPGPAVLALPLLAFIAFVTAFGVSLWLSALHVKYRDVGHVVPFLIQVWMYASPVIYPLSLVPERWRPLYSLNPMVGVVEGFRWALSGGPLPDLRAGAVSLSVVGLVLVSGLVYFRHTEREFADVI
jgi:lipopolysaccharide transport system permease protein